MSIITKAFRISTGDYKRARRNGAKSIIAPDERKNVVSAEVAEIAPSEYWLNYAVKEGE